MIEIMIATLMAAQPIPEHAERTIDATVVTMDQLHPKLEHAHAVSVAKAVIDAGERYDIDPLFLLAVSFSESRWNNAVKGDGGKSFGMFQMQLSVGRCVNWAGIFDGELRKPHSKRLLANIMHDIHWSARIAAAFIAHLRRKYGKRKGVRDAMVVYNCGPVRCKQANGSQRRETPATRAYKRNYNKLKKGYVKQ